MNGKLVPLFDRLPEELTKEIFSYCTRLELSLVCKGWERITREHAKEVKFSLPYVPSSVICSLLSSRSQLRDLSLKGTVIRKTEMEQIVTCINSHPCLTSLSLDVRTNPTISQSLSNLSKIQSIHINGFHTVMLASIPTNNLTSLSLTDLDGDLGTLIGFLKQLTCLESLCISQKMRLDKPYEIPVRDILQTSTKLKRVGILFSFVHHRV